MDILNSAWFLSMLKKSGTTPQQRLLGMFDILADWLDAPAIRSALAEDHTYPKATKPLESFLVLEARSLGAAMPELLAQQLYFIALTALKEELNSPHCRSVMHARTAAEALLKAQKQQRSTVSKPFVYGMAASLVASIAIGSAIFSFQTSIEKPPTKVAAADSQPLSTPPSLMASPSQTAELVASLEQMRKGTCYFPEALQLPDSEKAVYIENVVGGQITVNAQEQALMKKLMSKVRCNYTPMLMANSIS
jgi:hypothetical protein